MYDYNYPISDSEIETLNSVNLLYAIEQSLNITLELSLKLLKSQGKKQETPFGPSSIQILTFSSSAQSYNLKNDIITEFYYKVTRDKIPFPVEQQLIILENKLVTQRINHQNGFDYFNPEFSYAMVDSVMKTGDVQEKRDKCLGCIADVKKNSRSNHVEMVK